MMQRESVLAKPPADWKQRFLDAAVRLDTPVAACASSWSAAYREAAEPERAAQDAALLASRTTQRPVVVETAGCQAGFWRVSLYVLEWPVSHLRADRAGHQDEGLACYRLFVGALLDVHHSLDPATQVPHHDPRVVAYDGDDPYFVVAADKSTRRSPTIANAAAVDRGFWLGDAFASGGSLGYDHKAMAITSKGAETTDHSLATLSVAVRQINGLVSHSAPIPT